VSLDRGYFDALYTEHPDPWRLADRWYEQRKYALTLAALPRPRYENGFEPGCSVGVLTEQLADRCDRLLAVDTAAAAVAATRTRLAGREHVRVEHRELPAQCPAGPFDLVVLSEVGYYFDAADLDRPLAPGGDLVAVHWRHPVADYPLPGDAVHDRLAARPDLTRTVRHTEADFRLEVFARTPPAARSVAQAEGLC
jgi:hypothetical protein